jgi:aconitate hydratase
MDKSEFTRQIKIRDKAYSIFDINILEETGRADIKRLPFSIKILAENLMRNLDGRIVRESDLLNIARWQKTYPMPVEIPYHPARVLMQDFTGVPAVVDLAAMRDAVKDLGGDPKKINPLIPVELIVDHSVQVDDYGTADSLTKNVEKEYQRNRERYALLKWAQNSFDNFKVVPPNSGICHQVNLEYLGRVVITEEFNGKMIAYPDTLVGTDSHTPMINGIGVMGWGVGGIEAEAVMLGQPYYMSIPEVIGFKMVGVLKRGVTATDLVLSVTELLRKHNVVEKFVEYFGPGMKSLTVPDRATIGNMAPEYGATLGFFPVDEKTIDYLKMTNRHERAEIAEVYSKALGLFYTGSDHCEYTKVIEFDLSTVEPCMAGPARPQDRIPLKNLKKDDAKKKAYDFNLKGKAASIQDGSVVIAAITSCTNTSNPFVLLGAGLLAQKAVERGLKVPAHVKTSLAPGSKVVIHYLEDAGLMPYFNALGFYLAAFGCTTCIGNSGPLAPEIEKIVSENDLNVAAVLSGNRNFEARIHQRVKSNFLASPMLVVAFALAGRIDIDMTAEPIALDPKGSPVYLNDVWPAPEEIEVLINEHVKPEFFEDVYRRIFDGDEFWRSLPEMESTIYQWDDRSTYIKKPPYFDNFAIDFKKPKDVQSARTLLLVGDTVTTDHISPAGAIPAEYPAGRYLIDQSIPPEEFNSYGSRRGNHEVMMRGTFGNIRIKNKLVAPKEGSYTVMAAGSDEMFVFDAAMQYKKEGTPLLVLAGSEYGTGSSRDWAAKGTNLLGVKIVIAESYERIHRSNLVGMGVLPLEFMENESVQSLGLNGSETFFINGIEEITPRKVLPVKAVKEDGSEINFEVIARVDTDVDVNYLANGGILPYVLREMLNVDQD